MFKEHYHSPCLVSIVNFWAFPRTVIRMQWEKHWLTAWWESVTRLTRRRQTKILQKKGILATGAGSRSGRTAKSTLWDARRDSHGGLLFRSSGIQKVGAPASRWRARRGCRGAARGKILQRWTRVEASGASRAFECASRSVRPRAFSYESSRSRFSWPLAIQTAPSVLPGSVINASSSGRREWSQLSKSVTFDGGAMPRSPHMNAR